MGVLEDSVRMGVQEAIRNAPVQPFASKVMELIEEAGIECLTLMHGTPPDPYMMIESALNHIREALRLASIVEPH